MSADPAPLVTALPLALALPFSYKEQILGSQRTKLEARPLISSQSCSLEAELSCRRAENNAWPQGGFLGACGVWGWGGPAPSLLPTSLVGSWDVPQALKKMKSSFIIGAFLRTGNVRGWPRLGAGEVTEPPASVWDQCKGLGVNTAGFGGRTSPCFFPNTSATAQLSVLTS